jgi:aminotransferase in exopolysaccharide biosynthesis
MIPLSVPHISGNEWKYIKECLDTEWVSSAGKYVETFEENIRTFTGSKYAVACMNGTCALQVSLRLLGVEAGDEVIVPDVTFIAPVNVVRYLNAEPVFMDCDDYYNIDIHKTIKFITEETVFRNGFTLSRKTNKRISGIIPVHVFGSPADLEGLLTLCRERNIGVIEDATESLGAYYTKGQLKGRYTGTVGDIGCYSFNGNKIITTGGGGMIVTDNKEYAKKARYLSDQAKDDPVRYIHNEVGYNFRMTNIQAAMGVAQLERLPDYLEIKKRNYFAFKNAVETINGLRIADAPPYGESNYWFYCLQIDKKTYGRDSEKLMGILSEEGIQSRPVWTLNHLQKPYLDCQHYMLEKAFELADKTLNIPCSVNLKKTDVAHVIEVLKTNQIRP